VYLAREQASERLVAMKFVRHPGNPEALERFLTELRVLARLDHPNVVRVLASDFLRADPYFTMEYLARGSLYQAVKDGGALPPAGAVKLVRAIAGALVATHAEKVIHRDLKPSNILLTPDGTPKVADFGLAKRLDEVDPITRTTGALGTPNYMPPEQISRKNGDIGPWSDVYGLGATLYHLLTGRAPFVGKAREEVIYQVLTDPPERPRALRPEIPPALEGIVVKCLEKDPKDRYRTVAELAADLDRYETGQKPLAPPLTRARRARRWAARNRLALAGALCVALLLVGAFALGAIYWPRQKSPDPPGPPDPLAEIRKELAEGREVVLVGETGEPRWHRWRLGAATLGRSPVEGDGSCYFQAIETALLELLDDPGIDRYTVSAQFRYLASAVPATDGVVGPYFGYTEPGGPAANAFCRYYAVVTKEVKAGQVPPAEARLRVRDMTWTRRAGGAPMPQARDFVVRPLPLLTSTPGPWRTVILEVAPERIRFRWKPEPDAEEQLLAELVRLDEHQFVVTTTAKPGRPPDKRDVPPNWSPRLPIGIWADRAAVAFRNVVITPNP
jgi:serine/threonine-protein kinase